MSRSLPVIRDVPAQSCVPASCGSCTSCDDRSRAPYGILVVALITAIAATAWFMLRDPKPPTPPPAPLRIAPGLAAPAARPAAWTSPSPVVLVAVGARTKLPICSTWQMPHEPRGPCVNCHVVNDCQQVANAFPRPTPRLRLPTLTRNSLLPHPYAGPCGHCHVIRETSITRVDRDNMSVLNLTPTEQQLVRAGQRVVVPSLALTMQAPFIGQGSKFPHGYVGVCSNCHRVVDFGADPTREQVRSGLARGRERLLDLDLTAAQIRRAQPDYTGRRYTAVIASGVVALGLFFVSMIYVALKWYVQSKPKEEQGTYRKQLQLKKWFGVHEWASIAFAAATALHWWFSPIGSNLLHVAFLSVILLTLSGVLLRYKLPRVKVNKSWWRWLHAQRLLTIVLIITAIVGHLTMGIE